MHVKAYLKQIRRLDAMIELRVLEAEKWRALAESASAPRVSSDVKIQTTKKYDPMGDKVAKLVDLEREAQALWEAYMKKRGKIIEQIEGLDDADHIRVLRLRYIAYKPLDECAREMDYTERHTKRLHARALDAFCQKYKGEF